MGCGAARRLALRAVRGQPETAPDDLFKMVNKGDRPKKRAGARMPI